VEEGVWISFSPGVFHDYSFTSPDLLTYTLSIDGQLVRTGRFTGPWYDSYVCWGDGAQGASSLSSWDSVAFGNVPEPGASLILVVAGTGAATLRGRGVAI
jgi:hypothetical protein